MEHTLLNVHKLYCVHEYCSDPAVTVPSTLRSLGSVFVITVLAEVVVAAGVVDGAVVVLVVVVVVGTEGDSGDSLARSDSCFFCSLRPVSRFDRAIAT